MKLISVNISQPEPIEINGDTVLTGINKLPQTKRIWLNKINLVGDGQADLTVHGGEFQAVYSYPVEHYAHWQQCLAKDALPYGTFGENFTVSGLLETDVYVGDMFKVGGAVIQATMPRIPCFKLANKLNNTAIIKDFLWSGYSGFYHKVIEEGEVGAGDEITLLAREADSISIRAALGLYKLNEGDANALSHALTIKSLAPLFVDAFSERLAKLDADGKGDTT
ncbi:MAG: MOSC domain-containing protein [Methylophilaceae bacterium]|nr:MAG: MOSC domain-containing protein [Methylophilaceae bacterium]